MINPIDYSNYNPFGSSIVRNPSESTLKIPGRESSPAECETCKNRKYQDGSDEMVSYKAPTRISPGRAASAVRAHEQEHVSNAYSDAAQNNGKVLSANVTLKTSICPECGRSYVAGGTTQTQIKYYNEKNPYQQDLRNTDAIKYKGMNVDIAC
ncbi:MAG: hypothetical protein ACI4DN_11655 [Lachnospiraceae bacterium]